MAFAYFMGQDALVDVASDDIARGICKNQPLGHVEVVPLASQSDRN